jgi:hypothetical protein
LSDGRTGRQADIAPDIVNVSSLTESGIRRFSIGLAQGTGLVTDALDSSKMTLMPSTTRNKANVHSRAKRSLAKCAALRKADCPFLERCCKMVCVFK